MDTMIRISLGFGLFDAAPRVRVYGISLGAFTPKDFADFAEHQRVYT